MFDKILNRSCIAKVMENSGFTFFFTQLGIILMTTLLILVMAAAQTGENKGDR